LAYVKFLFYREKHKYCYTQLNQFQIDAMKKNSGTLFITGLMLLSTVVLNGQDESKKTRFNLGCSPLQAFYIGFDHSLGTYSFGIDAGTYSDFWSNSAKYYSISLDNSVAFGKPDRHSIKTWHFNGRLTYSAIVDEGTNEPRMLYLIPAFGKEINFSHNLGMNLEIGAGIRLMYNEKEPDRVVPDGFTIYVLDKPLLPDLRIEFFYRF